MHAVTIGGVEYCLRCDVNAYEEIVGKYGDLKEALNMESGDVGKLKFLTALFINEHNYFIDSPERVTEKQIGARMMPHERAAVYTAIMETVNDAFAPKN